MFYPVPPENPAEIQALRVRHGLANYQAANLINVSLSSWSRYESGDMKMTTLNWALLLNALGELELPEADELTPFAKRALSFVPPVSLKAGNQRAGYKSPDPKTIAAMRERAGLSRAQCNELMGFKSNTHWGKFERGEIEIAEREWVIFQVAIQAINPPVFSDFETALKKVPSYSKDDEYTAPSPDEIKAFLKANHLTQAEAAAIVGVSARAFRFYVSGQRIVEMPQLAWQTLQNTFSNAGLPENPDNSKLPEPIQVTTKSEVQKVFEDIALAADIVKKRNEKRKKDFLPVFKMEFMIFRQPENKTAFFYRSPDYVNECWSMWCGISSTEEQISSLLTKLSKRLGAINVQYK